MTGRPPGSTLFPYTTLFRSEISGRAVITDLRYADWCLALVPAEERGAGGGFVAPEVRAGEAGEPARDRKSTRLNSSHRCISYAVFCLKKKKNKRQKT